MRLICGIKLLLFIVGVVPAAKAKIDDGWYENVLAIFENSVVIKAEIEVPEQGISNTKSLYEEYHDNERNTHVAKITGKTGDVEVYHLNGRMQQMAVIKDKTCKAGGPANMTEDALIDFDSGSMKLGLAARFERLRKVVWISGQYVLYRGIPCIEMKAKFNNEDYLLLISDKKYDSTGGSAPVLDNFPMKISRSGGSKVFEVFEIMYINSQPNMLDYLLDLQIPAGIGCPDYQTIFVPPVQEIHSYVAEINLNGASFYSDNYYDLSNGLSNVVVDDVESIKDNEEGVEYTISDGSCEVKKVNKDTMNKEDFFKDSILQIEADVYPVGQEYVRGLLCDVYEGIITEKEILTVWEFPGNATVRYYYSTDLTSLATDTNVEADVPILFVAKNIIRTPEDQEMTYAVNMYNFYQTDDDVEFIENFDIENCIPEKSYMQLTFYADTVFSEAVMSEHAETWLRNNITNLIATKTGVRRIRFPSIKVEVLDSQSIMATILTLDQSPRLSFFDVDDKKIAEGLNMFGLMSHDDESACAGECLARTDCAAFLSCPGKCLGSASTSSDSWDLKPDGAEECSIYRRIDPNSKAYKNITLALLGEMLENATVDGTLEFKFTTSEGTHEFHAMAFQSNLEPFDPQSKGAPFRYLTSGYSYNKDNELNREIDDTSSQTISGCYRSCRDATDISCAGFSFCPKSTKSKCVISSKFVSSNDLNDTVKDKVLVNTNNCDLYFMNVMKAFNKDNGQVRIKKTEDAVDGVMTAEECAIKCRNDDGMLHCLGFEYCGEAKVCMMFDEHHDHTKEAEGNETLLCYHYSLKPSADYDLLFKAKYIDSSAVHVGALSEAECAKQCSEFSDGCNSFTYCADQSCALSHINVDDAMTPDKFDKDVYCGFYLENGMDQDIIRPKNRGAPVEDTGSGLREGGLAGLLVAMMIVGAIFGAAGLMYYPAIKARASPARRNTISAEPIIEYSANQDNEEA